MPTLVTDMSSKLVQDLSNFHKKNNLRDIWNNCQFLVYIDDQLPHKTRIDCLHAKYAGFLFVCLRKYLKLYNKKQILFEFPILSKNIGSDKQMVSFNY